jgi:hypothetical protein
MGIHTAYQFRHWNGDGKLLWASSLGEMSDLNITKKDELAIRQRQDWELNTLVDEGEKDILDVYFDDVAVRATLYFRLYNDAGIVETDTLATLTPEVTGTSYDGIAVTRGTDWPDPTLDSGDMKTTSVTKTFTAGGTWTTANQLVLATVQNGTAGLFIAWVALSAARTLLINDTLDVSMGVKLA